MQITLLFVCVQIACSALYLLFAGQTSTDELIPTGPVALACAVLVVSLRLLQDRRIRTTAPWLRLVWRVSVSLLRDTWLVGVALARVVVRPPEAALGAVADQNFRGGGEAPEDAGRRGLVVIANSLAPNGIVIDAAPGLDRLRLHRLVAAAPNADAEWPV
jgi:hypothetical protein